MCVWCVYALWCVCVCMRAKANALADVEARVNARCLTYTPPFAPLEVGWSSLVTLHQLAMSSKDAQSSTSQH